MIGKPRRHFDEVESTNEAARDWARAGAPHGAVVTADAQSGGRGRRGRSWSSPPGKGLYLSAILRPLIEVAQLPQLTILAALCAARAIEHQMQLAARVKWPNDVLVNDRKIAGVLCEAEFEATEVAFVILGLGLNVNFETRDLPPRPLFPATSLLMETQREHSVEAMAAACLQELEVLYGDFARGEWPRLREEFLERSVGLGRAVTVQLENANYEAVAETIDDDGILVVRAGDELRRVVAGDVLWQTA